MKSNTEPKQPKREDYKNYDTYFSALIEYSIIQAKHNQKLAKQNLEKAKEHSELIKQLGEQQQKEVKQIVGQRNIKWENVMRQIKQLNDNVDELIRRKNKAAMQQASRSVLRDYTACSSKELLLILDKKYGKTQ